MRRLVAILAAWFALGASGALAQDYPVAVRQVSYIDASRPIKPSGAFPGTPARRIDVMVWYPAAADRGKPGRERPVAKGGPWPLVIYSHGTFGRPDNATHLAEHLARHGYIVAAPNYPLTSSTAFTAIAAPDISDVANQVRDVSFLIDRLLSDPQFAPAIEASRIGATGHSLGGVTSYFASFGAGIRDARIKAAALIGAGDPVQAALSTDMGLQGTGHAAVPVPVLFLSAEHDVFARMMGRPGAAYARVEGPKYEAMIRGGVHVWFNDGQVEPADGRNPDCLFFDRWMPGVPVPGCSERPPLIGAARQQEITRAAVREFFDAWLKGDEAARRRLERADRDGGDTAINHSP